MSSDQQITANWLARLKTRLELLDKANRSVRYWSQRAGTAHGLDMLRAAVAMRVLRNGQVAEARKVLARHGQVQAISAEGLAFIAGREGFRANVYRDAVGVLTQGYGETQNLTPGKPWTREFALARLEKRVHDDYMAPVLALAEAIKWHIRQNEADALASLVYNLGPGILDKGRTMGDAIRAHDRMRTANAFLVYDKAGGRPLLGLTLRRRAERLMFLK